MLGSIRRVVSSYRSFIIYYSYWIFACIFSFYNWLVSSALRSYDCNYAILQVICFIWKSFLLISYFIRRASSLSLAPRRFPYSAAILLYFSSYCSFSFSNFLEWRCASSSSMLFLLMESRSSCNFWRSSHLLYVCFSLISSCSLM